MTTDEKLDVLAGLVEELAQVKRRCSSATDADLALIKRAGLLHNEIMRELAPNSRGLIANYSACKIPAIVNQIRKLLGKTGRIKLEKWEQ